MTAMDTLLFNDPAVKAFALKALEECTDLKEFGRRCLEALLNSAMSAHVSTRSPRRASLQGDSQGV